MNPTPPFIISIFYVKLIFLQPWEAADAAAEAAANFNLLCEAYFSATVSLSNREVNFGNTRISIFYVKLIFLQRTRKMMGIPYFPIFQSSMWSLFFCNWKKKNIRKRNWKNISIFYVKLIFLQQENDLNMIQVPIEKFQSSMWSLFFCNGCSFNRIYH